MTEYTSVFLSWLSIFSMVIDLTVGLKSSKNVFIQEVLFMFVIMFFYKFLHEFFYQISFHCASCLREIVKKGKAEPGKLSIGMKKEQFIFRNSKGAEMNAPDAGNVTGFALLFSMLPSRQPSRQQS